MCDFDVVEKIVFPLIEVADQIQLPNVRDLWDRISKADESTVFVLSQIIAESGVPRDSAQKTLADATRLGIVEPVFRLRTDTDLVEYQNCWTPTPVILRRVFKTIQGEEIDGSDPGNVVVAYRRASKGDIAR